MKSFFPLAILLLTLFGQAAFASPDASVNVNTAAPEILAEVLDGVGSAKAKAIVDYREKFGEFNSVEELMDVRGIGLKVIDANREKIAFSD